MTAQEAKIKLDKVDYSGIEKEINSLIENSIKNGNQYVNSIIKIPATISNRNALNTYLIDNGFSNIKVKRYVDLSYYNSNVTDYILKVSFWF
jgi:hypothetical protein